MKTALILLATITTLAFAACERNATGPGDTTAPFPPVGITSTSLDHGVFIQWIDNQEPDLVGEAHMRRLLDEADSSLAGSPITRRWACQRAFAEDRKMRLGRDPNRPWLVWAAGLGGHGATASPAIGERVASAVVEAL